MVTLMKRTAREVCTCKGYAFPHRLAGGACLGKQHGPFCGECGEPTEAVTRDFGYGALEAWGQRFTHTDLQTVSRCCDADLYADASLTTEYDPN